MERTEPITLTNMCMVYDGQGNVLVEEKITDDRRGLIFPGGHVEEHEPITDSIVREIREETGLTITDVHLCGIKDFIVENGSRYMVFMYKTCHYSGELRSSEEGRVFWMPLEELKKVEPMWYFDQMLEIFCGDNYSELYFDKRNMNTCTPELK